MAPLAPELQALSRVLASYYGRAPHVADRDALHVLNALGDAHWALDRTAKGIRIDTAAEELAEELAAVPIINAAEAVQQKAA